MPPASLNKVKLKVLNKDTSNPKVKDKPREVTVAHKVSAVPDTLTEATKLRTGPSTVSTEVAGTVTLDGSSRSPVASERLVMMVGMRRNESRVKIGNDVHSI